MNPVLLQQLLVPGATVQRVSKTQELPGGEDDDRGWGVGVRLQVY